MSRHYPRVREFTHHQIEKFNKLQRLLKQGRLPAYLLNPCIILSHNECSPEVAKLHETSEVSIDSLLVLAAGDGTVGVHARSSLRWALRKPDTTRHVEEDAIEDPKLHAMLDQKEKE